MASGSSEFSYPDGVPQQRCKELKQLRGQLAIAAGMLAGARHIQAELTAENARLRAELDAAGRKSVLLCPASAMLDAMEASAGEESGTIIRATDEPGLEFELRSDRLWYRR